MDFKELVNKESFKAILLHHLKCQSKQKLGGVISKEIKENLATKKNSTTENIVDEVSKNILESNDFSVFLSSFLSDIDNLLVDKDTYVPKDEKRDNVSQCSSASSLNASSIDFLSPDQFQSTIFCLKTGTNAEKLEALETLHRLPTLEHLTNKSFWSDAEIGLHDSLSSNVMFLRTAAMKLFVKMLSSSESKIVLDSYLSLIKFMHKNLLPHQHEASIDAFRSSVKVVAIFNKFLQTISAHWLRYPQSVIENISAQCLSLFSDYNEMAFPVWTCFALFDPVAKWAKNILYGYLSRAAFLIALENDPRALRFCVTFCTKFVSEKFNTDFICCQNSVFISEITHALSFLSYLLQYSDGRKIFDSESCGEVLPCWSDGLEIIMKSANIFCRMACINCCSPVCGVISPVWCSLWNQDVNLESYDTLMKILVSTFSDVLQSDLNLIYFAVQCLSYSFEGILSISASNELNLNFANLITKLLTYCSSSPCLTESTDSTNFYIQKYLLGLVKSILSTPSFLFLNEQFTESLCNWWQKLNENSTLKMLSKKQCVSDYNSIEKNFIDVNIALLSKPFGVLIIQDSSGFETTLNILLEKLLTDIKFKKAVCSHDIACLTTALNNNISPETVLNRTIVFRLSSILWQLNEANDCDNLNTKKDILEMLVPSVFCDVVNLDLLEINSLEKDVEVKLFHSLLLSPKLADEYLTSEEYGVVALQVLALLTTNVHAVCCLEEKYHLSDLLLEQQCRQITLDGNPLVDVEFILRNYILVKIYTFGGPNERVLPEEELMTGEDYKWPLVNSFPLPGVFYKPVTVSAETKLEFFEHMTVSVESELQLEEEMQLLALRDAFHKFLKTIDGLPTEFSTFIFKRSSSILRTNIESFEVECSMPLECTNHFLNGEELVGISLVRRYGSILDRMIDEENGKLEQILKAAKYLTSSKSNQIDLFVCTVYLMCYEDIDLVWSFLKNFSKTPNSFLIWFSQISDSAEISELYRNVHAVILEMCDIAVKKSLPQVFSALQFFGVLPSALFSYWMVQCFWNYLDFSEISNLVLLNVLYSGLFSIYFFISVLKHLQSYILLNAHDCSLIANLKKNPIKNYKMQDYIDYIMELSTTYRHMESHLLPLLKKINFSSMQS